MKAGFIGLGHLGKAIAKRLMSEGVDLIVWNRTREKAADLGEEVADSSADVTSKVETIFLNLFDSRAVLALSMSSFLFESIATMISLIPYYCGQVVSARMQRNSLFPPGANDPCELPAWLPGDFSLDKFQ